ncbi:MAG: hypothetical protein HFI76_02415 [Lachnospiraceae bacterium]|jgi:hypothetical protein|nr:hypothetical protein [Lachnospiraceae bacterium]
MGYRIRETRTEQDFSAKLKGKKIPILVLDQKWHHIFAGTKKPDIILKYEKQVDEELARQGRLTQELKELKKLKSTLMKNIVENMEGAELKDHPSSKKLSQDRRLIDEINEKMERCEDDLLELPHILRQANDNLMTETMKYCYGLLRTNETDIEEIGEWIKNIRVELKKQIIIKQSAEIKNKEIYSYMHDIFGPQVIDVFDLKYESKEEDAQDSNNGKKEQNNP